MVVHPLNSVLADIKALKPFLVPSGLTLDAFSLSSSLSGSGGVVRLARACLYPMLAANPATI